MTSDALHPQMRAVLARLAEQTAGAPSRYDMPFTQSRIALESQRAWWIEAAPPMREERAATVIVDGRSVGLRHYTPRVGGSEAPIAYLHGGGWCVGSWRTHAGIHRGLADATGREVIAIDYSLAPEHPFPAAIDDVARILDPLLEAHPGLVVAGDSAGANLALVDAMRRRDMQARRASALLLFYGTFGPVRRDGSFARWGMGGYGLTLAALDRYLDAYAPAAEAADWRVFPLTGALHDLPRTLIVAAECDPLADDSLAMDARLRSAGTASTLLLEQGVIHGFLAYARLLDAAPRALSNAARWLRGELLGGSQRD